MNLKKMFVGVLFIVASMYWGAYVQLLLNQYLPWLPTGFTYWLWGFIPLSIGLGTIALALGVLLLLIGLFV